MKRRRFLAAGCGCAAMLAWSRVYAQSAWHAPARFSRPDVSSDEGGLWAIMDREETRLRRSPFALRDARLVDYVQSIACRLAGDHCPDIRVHLVRTPLFNAAIAPNGMMQIWTGLLLRVENEAQLAAVIGHEIGHYLERHLVERLRDVRTRSTFAQFLGAFGLAGAVGQVALLAGALAYSRDQERDADRIGVHLMSKAGYDPAEAAKIWSNLLVEIQARQDRSASSNALFATHPAPEERQQMLAELSRSAAGGVTNEEAWREGVRPYLREWLAEEVRRGQHEESLALFSRMLARSSGWAEVLYARGEVYRLRAKESDWEAALADYQAAVEVGGEPPETHRALGIIQRMRKRRAEAKASFERYLERSPHAPDVAMIKRYIEELGE